MASPFTSSDCRHVDSEWYKEAACRGLTAQQLMPKSPRILHTKPSTPFCFETGFHAVNVYDGVVVARCAVGRRHCDRRQWQCNVSDNLAGFDYANGVIREVDASSLTAFVRSGGRFVVQPARPAALSCSAMRARFLDVNGRRGSHSVSSLWRPRKASDARRRVVVAAGAAAAAEFEPRSWH
jgi:hypothetical protein